MPPNFQRFLPFVLIAVVFFVLPSLRKKHTSKGTS
jgi:hypothetical protein